MRREVTVTGVESGDGGYEAEARGDAGARKRRGALRETINGACRQARRTERNNKGRMQKAGCPEPVPH